MNSDMSICPSGSINNTSIHMLLVTFGSLMLYTTVWFVPLLLNTIPDQNASSISISILMLLIYMNKQNGENYGIPLRLVYPVGAHTNRHAAPWTYERKKRCFHKYDRYSLNLRQGLPANLSLFEFQKIPDFWMFLWVSTPQHSSLNIKLVEGFLLLSDWMHSAILVCSENRDAISIKSD